MCTSCKLSILLLWVLTIHIPTFAQISEIHHLQGLVDSIYGQNDLLINGRIFIETHPQAKGHPFFPEESSSEGTVFIKGEKFGDIQVNYNAELDQLVLDVEESMPWIHYIVLNNRLVDSFLLGGHSFVNVQALSAEKDDKIYLEQLFSGHFRLFAKHQKSFKAEFNRWNPHGKYLAKPTKHLLLEDGFFHDVTGKKRLLRYFEKHRKELKKFLHQHRIKLKKANPEQLKQIAAFCNDLS